MDDRKESHEVQEEPIIEPYNENRIGAGHFYFSIEVSRRLIFGIYRCQVFVFRHNLIPGFRQLKLLRHILLPLNPGS